MVFNKSIMDWNLLVVCTPFSQLLRVNRFVFLQYPLRISLYDCATSLLDLWLRCKTNFDFWSFYAPAFMHHCASWKIEDIGYASSNLVVILPIFLCCTLLMLLCSFWNSCVQYIDILLSFGQPTTYPNCNKLESKDNKDAISTEWCFS